MQFIEQYNSISIELFFEFYCYVYLNGSWKSLYIQICDTQESADF